MYDFCNKALNADNRSDEKKDDPEKMNKDDNVSKNRENHRNIIVSHHCRFCEKLFEIVHCHSATRLGNPVPYLSPTLAKGGEGGLFNSFIFSGYRDSICL